MDSEAQTKPVSEVYSVSIAEMRAHLKYVLSLVQGGHRVYVTKNGAAVAQILPLFTPGEPSADPK